MFLGFPAGTDPGFSPVLMTRGRGGSEEERCWCFAQVKGPSEVNSAEGKKRFLSLSSFNNTFSLCGDDCLQLSLVFCSFFF